MKISTCEEVRRHSNVAQTYTRKGLLFQTFSIRLLGSSHQPLPQAGGLRCFHWRRWNSGSWHWARLQHQLSSWVCPWRKQQIKHPESLPAINANAFQHYCDASAKMSMLFDRPDRKQLAYTRNKHSPFPASRRHWA